MNNEAFATDMLDELLGKTKPGPETARLVLKAIAVSARAGIRPSESLKSARRLLMKYDVMTPEELASLSIDEAIDRIEAAAEALCAVTSSEQQGATQLASRIAEAISLSETDTALLALAIHACHERDLREALELADALDTDHGAAIIAPLVELPVTDVVLALSGPSPMRERDPSDWCRDCTPLDMICPPRSVARLLMRGEERVDRLLAVFFKVAPDPVLSLDDFQAQGELRDLLKNFIAASVHTRKPGINVLLHGAPGTGKTQFVRALSKALGCLLVEVATDDNDGDPLPPAQRIKSLLTTQVAMRLNHNALIVFDEVEDIFPNANPMAALFGHARGGGDQIKGWLARVIEDGERPTFWLCNTIDQIDPAYLRRFDLVLEMRGPDRAARERLIAELFQDVPITADQKRQLLTQQEWSPGHLSKLAGATKLLRTVDAHPENRLDFMIQEGQRALGIARKVVSSRPLRFRPECINADADLIALGNQLKQVSSARICLFGPPGTGKTEWARHVAEETGRPLHIHRGADLLGKYVGETEKRIRDAFERAADTRALLLVDEADTFLRDRDRANQWWELSMANEFLTALETFEGMCIVSTNAIDRLDPAAARRFDFKIRFDALRNEQKRALLLQLLSQHGGEPPDDVALARLLRLEPLVPGDFATVARRMRVCGSSPCPHRFVEELKKEVDMRLPQGAHRIGFV